VFYFLRLEVNARVDLSTCLQWTLEFKPNVFSRVCLHPAGLILRSMRLLDFCDSRPVIPSDLSFGSPSRAIIRAKLRDRVFLKIFDRLGVLIVSVLKSRWAN
jgi:hypothetical protein